MMAFWDTSAVLALIYVEPRSPDAAVARSLSAGRYAWRWMAVEAQAGLARRRARPAEWEALDRILSDFQYVDLSVEQTAGVGRANRDWRLRASDAGHLYCFQQVAFALPDMQLICFDEEINTAASAIGLSIWTPPAAGMPDRVQVREKARTYGRSAGGKKPRP